jgi:small GTP-binding protein
MNINMRLGEIGIKIVYYGPPYSGKTTNIERLHATANPGHRSELTSMKNKEDRTLFFDFMQLELGQIGGLTPRINLYTVPGQVIYEATRQIVLRGADAIVFVADSSAKQLRDNLWSWRQLTAQLVAMNCDPEKFPVVVQLNKRDLPDALSVQDIRKGLNLNGHRCIEAQARRDIGTRETLRAAVKAVLGADRHG